MKAQLSIEFLAVLSVALLSVSLLPKVAVEREIRDEQAVALLIDELSAFGAPFGTNITLIDKECSGHRMGNARTLTKELIMKGGYRYRTHNIKSPVLT